MSKGTIREKNQKMADYLKKHNVRRTTTQCPFGHHSVGLNGLVEHLRTCKNGLARMARK